MRGKWKGENTGGEIGTRWSQKRNPVCGRNRADSFLWQPLWWPWLASPSTCSHLMIKTPVRKAVLHIVEYCVLRIDKTRMVAGQLLKPQLRTVNYIIYCDILIRR